jgi:cytosine/adenosine deaminase-related metal-dependent hydrolase
MMGTPMAFSTTHDIQSHSSLGIDCHSATSGSLVSEMRLLLQSARGAHNEQISNAGKIPHHVNKTVLEAFNLATISGARAINEEAQIGSLAEGKLADIIIFDALSPAMVGAAQQDPVAAVVLHSSPADIDMLIIDGVIRKQNGKLSSVEIAPDHAKWAGDKETLVWADVAKEIMVRRKGIADQLSGLDMVKGYEGAMKAFYLTPDVLADSV